MLGQGGGGSFVLCVRCSLLRAAAVEWLLLPDAVTYACECACFIRFHSVCILLALLSLYCAFVRYAEERGRLFTLMERKLAMDGLTRIDAASANSAIDLRSAVFVAEAATYLAWRDSSQGHRIFTTISSNHPPAPSSSRRHSCASRARSIRCSN